MLLSLTISDCMQTLLVSVVQLIARLSDVKTTSTFCQVLRKINECISAMTMATSGGSILFLSVERYVACIYCFHKDQILTRKRVDRGLRAIWLLGIACAFGDYKRYQWNLSAAILPLHKVTSFIYGSIIITNIVILAFIQVSLYRVARKLIRGRPRSSSGSDVATVTRLRIVELKASMYTSAIVVLYVVCMFPLALYILVQTLRTMPLDEMSNVRLFCIFFSQINTIVNPFVYGYGMEDTRKSLRRELRKIIAFLRNLFHRDTSERGLTPI